MEGQEQKPALGFRFSIREILLILSKREGLGFAVGLDSTQRDVAGAVLGRRVHPGL